MNFLYRHQFTVGEPAPILALGIGLELQAVAAGQGKFFRLADGDFIQFFEQHWPDTVVGLNQQMPVGDAAQFPCAAGFETGRWTVEHQNGFRLVKPLVAFLRIGQILPLQRCDGCFNFAN